MKIFHASLQRLEKVAGFSNAQFQQKITGMQRNKEIWLIQKDKTDIQKQSLKKHMLQTYFKITILSMLKELREIRKTIFEWNESIYKKIEII